MSRSCFQVMVIAVCGFSCLLTVACLSSRENFRAFEVDYVDSSYIKSYPFEFTRVLRAIRIVLKDHSMAKDNEEKGILETKIVKKNQFKTLFQEEKSSSSRVPFRYKIQVRVYREGEEGKPLTQVAILKKILFKKHFFSSEETLKSDGLEEQVILYRIGRELEIEEEMKKAFDPSNPSEELSESSSPLS